MKAPRGDAFGAKISANMTTDRPVRPTWRRSRGEPRVGNHPANAMPAPSPAPYSTRSRGAAPPGSSPRSLGATLSSSNSILNIVRLPKNVYQIMAMAFTASRTVRRGNRHRATFQKGKENMTQQRVLVTRVNSDAAVRPTLEVSCFYRRRNSTALKKIREYLRIHYGDELNQHNNSQISWALDILRRWGIAKHARKRGEWGLTDYGLLDPPPPTDEQICWVRDKCFTITIIPPQQRQEEQTEPTEIEPAERLAMIPELFLDRIAALYRGDDLKVLPKLAANSMDNLRH